MKFSDLIKIIRRKSLLSQSDFANEIGVSFSTVNRWENGKAVPKLCKLKLIKDFCVKHNIPFDVDTYVSGNDKTGME
ncbi:MAG: helix-turn-helix domain-containing protein [Lachnospiraceae bacterium]